MKKEILVDAIIGKGIGSYNDASLMCLAGYARFSGNQWNEKWEFRRDVLEKLDEQTLAQIYTRNIK